MVMVIYYLSAEGEACHWVAVHVIKSENNDKSRSTLIMQHIIFYMRFQLRENVFDVAGLYVPTRVVPNMLA